ncbi:muscarinic acetylcholine receptor M5-like [Ascaphus truei]|uniref:muscarinic acetylcholine receptor M5-like n=1 Tax=Ascaphus truei TaxID=8439 RepID=UPI003F5AC1AE
MRIYYRNASVSYTDHLLFNITSVSNQSQGIPEDVKIIQAVLMSCMISVTGAGNALVILGFVTDKNLRTTSNYFLLNLAISDFFTGTFTLPLFLENYIINGEWVLGKNVCKIWLSINCTLFQCTIYNIVLISYDRFLAVTKAVRYRDQQNKMKPAFMKMAAVWVIAFLNFSPAIIVWEYVVGYSLVPDGECIPDFSYSSYLLYSSFFDFFTPMTAIAFFNLSIYYNIRKRIKMKPQTISTSLNDSSPNYNREDIFIVDSANVISNYLPSMAQRDSKCLSNKNKRSVIDLLLSICKTSPNHLREKVLETTEISNRLTSHDSIPNSALSKDKKVAKFAVCAELAVYQKEFHNLSTEQEVFWKQVQALSTELEVSRQEVSGLLTDLEIFQNEVHTLLCYQQSPHRTGNLSKGI